MTAMRHAIGSVLLGSLLLLTGCPAGAGASTPQQLRLSLNSGEPSAKVGDRRTFTVMFGPQGEGQMMTSAMISSDPPSLTQWHADPADAVTFDPTTAAATFSRPGTVKIWASVTDASGQAVRSNELTVTVAQ
jgi:hypothetical protein